MSRLVFKVTTENRDGKTLSQGPPTLDKVFFLPDVSGKPLSIFLLQLLPRPGPTSLPPPPCLSVVSKRTLFLVNVTGTKEESLFLKQEPP